MDDRVGANTNVSSRVRGKLTVLYAFSGYAVFGEVSLCGGLTFLDILKYLRYVYLLLQTAVAVTAIIFLVGICIDKPEFTVYFIYAALIGMIMTLIMLTVTLIAFFIDMSSPYCTFPVTGVMCFVTNFSIWFYFVVVLKSYYEE